MPGEGRRRLGGRAQSGAVGLVARSVHAVVGQAQVDRRRSRAATAAHQTTHQGDDGLGGRGGAHGGSEKLEFLAEAKSTQRLCRERDCSSLEDEHADAIRPQFNAERALGDRPVERPRKVDEPVGFQLAPRVESIGIAVARIADCEKLGVIFTDLRVLNLDGPELVILPQQARFSRAPFPDLAFERVY